MKRVLLSLVLFASVLPAATIDFALLPGATITGTAGSKIGWGYTVTDNSADEWLIFTDLNADPFASATPAILFDFPILSPGATVTREYDSTLRTGLLELTLNNVLLSQVTNTGNFVLGAQWWSGDPFSGGTYIEDADPVVVGYTAIASPASVPEPATGLLVGGVLSALLWRRRRAKHSAGQPQSPLL
jgi:hypothetical protein